MLLHLLYTIESLVYLTITLETERNCYDTNGKYAHLLGNSCDNRCSTSTGTTSHTCCDEGHAGAVAQHLGDILKALLSCLTGLLWLVSCSKTFLTQLQMNRYGRVVKSLIICVAQHECNIVDAFTIHVVYSVAATTSYTNDFYYALILLRSSEVEDIDIHVLFHITNFLPSYFFTFLPFLHSSETMSLPNSLAFFMNLFQKLFSLFSCLIRWRSFSSSSRR